MAGIFAILGAVGRGLGNSHRPRAVESTRVPLRQFVLVSTDWRVWQLESKPHDSLNELIRNLVRPTGEAPGRAWFALAGAEGSVPDTGWFPSTECELYLNYFHRALEAASAERLDTKERAHRLGSLRARVTCDPERSDHLQLTTGKLKGLCWTTLDIRFLRLLETHYVHLGIGFWTMPPPWVAEPLARKDAVVGTDAIDTLVSSVRENRPTSPHKAARTLAEKHFRGTRTRVWGHEYLPPLFWVVTPPRELTHHDPAGYEDEPALMDGVVRPLLHCGHGDCVVTGSVVNGQVLTYRRFYEEPRDGHGPAAPPDTYRSTYVLLPRRGVDADAIPTGIAWLTDIEARTAVQLNAHNSRLEIARNHVEIYDHASNAASQLWDALAFHLPARERQIVASAHRTIELLHQTLLQGIADIADLMSDVDKIVQQLDDLGDELAERFDSAVTETHLPSHEHTGQASIRASLTRSGHFERLKRMSRSTSAEAHRVSDMFKDQLQSIAHAFDERRVRELEGLQRAGSILSMVLGAFAIVTVLDFLIEVRGHWDNAVPRWTAIALVLLLSVVALSVVARPIWRVIFPRHISSDEFAICYELVNDFLRDTSTRELGHAMKEGKTNWEEKDDLLATRFTRLWDGATRTTDEPARDDADPRVHQAFEKLRRRTMEAGTAPRGRNAYAELDKLAAEVELWTIRTLLLTERPRRLFDFPLPKLTLLYRHCTALKRAVETEGKAVKLVADIDVWLALGFRGFTWDEARKIDEWVARRVDYKRSRSPAESPAPRSTTELLKIIEQLPITAKMTRLPDPEHQHDRDNVMKQVSP